MNLQRAGYRVTTAGDGEEALAKVAADRPDLIVFDVMMPRVDGFETIKRLKQDPETANIPVVMLTAKAQDADLFKGYQYGADIYLTKPFNPLEFLAFIRRILEDTPELATAGKVFQL